MCLEKYFFKDLLEISYNITKSNRSILMLYMTIWFTVVLRQIIKRQQMQKYNNPNAYDKTHKTLHPIIHEHL